ncbi:hypothetical protein [Marinimicrococcus flavescens]|uniref:Uncharacterized protein n=1 Tax=Marinimicrococcus flavescens TaxID=3031815 RepID=A0AAP3XQM5_9PROT|nr:hypothetical protein [Marinimicrococcus flavescens]
MAEHHHSLDRAFARLPGPDDPRPYLGSLEDVERILRGFMGVVHARWCAGIPDEQAREAAIEADKAECLRLARVFLGQHPDEYNAVGSWNTEGEIARFCAKVAGIEGTDPLGIMNAVFQLLLLRYYEGMNMIDEGGSPEDAASMVNRRIENTWHMLLGMYPVGGGLDPDES